MEGRKFMENDLYIDNVILRFIYVCYYFYFTIKYLNNYGYIFEILYIIIWFLLFI